MSLYLANKAHSSMLGIVEDFELPGAGVYEVRKLDFKLMLV
jgi:hypothetical protein